MAQEQPNILLVFIDSMRADHVSCYGYHRETTPNIDRIAAEGCLFENAFTAAPFSPASYASVFTNQYPSHHGVNGDSVRTWPDTFETLAEKLKRSGYSTFAISTNAFVSRAAGCSRGFDNFHELYLRSWIARKYSGLVHRVGHILPERLQRILEPDHVRWPEMVRSTHAIQLACNCIDSLPAPFFGVLILMDPHAPYLRSRRQFCRNKKGRRAFLSEVNDGQMWARLMATRASLSQDQLDAAIDLYDSEIYHSDSCVGRLYDGLVNRGVCDTTLLAVAADHGEAFGEQGVWGHGFTLNDCLTRVPLVLRLPDVFDASRRSKALVQLHDLHTTCCNLALLRQGEVRREHCLTNASEASWCGRSAVLSEFPVQYGTLELFKKLNPEFEPQLWGTSIKSARNHRLRLVRYENEKESLFDVTNGEVEQDSAAGVDGADVASLREAIESLNVDFHEGPSRGRAESGIVDDEEIMQRLRDLGYTH